MAAIAPRAKGVKSHSEGNENQMNPDPLNSDDDDPGAETLAIYEPVYAFVRTVPVGKVVTYGQVADCLTGVSLTARQVGTAMRYAPPDVPWQRVVGAGGRLPIAKLSPQAKVRQRDLLAAEGVHFSNREEDRVDMARSQWNAPAGNADIDDLFAASDGEA
jgi:methylated-DNA-protein-cysteine methyltransferase-like protein